MRAMRPAGVGEGDRVGVNVGWCEGVGGGEDTRAREGKCVIERGGGDVGGGAASAVGVGDRSIGAARRRITMTVSARGCCVRTCGSCLVYFVGYILFMCPMIAMEDMVKGLAGAAARGGRATTNDVTDECVFDLVRANA